MKKCLVFLLLSSVPFLEWRIIKMLNFIWKWLGVRQLKGALDKLPMNGRKTAVGVLIVLLSVAATFFPEYAEVLRGGIDFLKTSFESSPILTTGAVTATIGFLHKILKALETLLIVAQAQEVEEQKKKNV